MSVDWDALVLVPLIDQIFGDEIVYAPKSGASTFPVQGVYDEAYVEIDPASGMALTTEMPVVGVREQAFLNPESPLSPQPLPIQGDHLTVVKTGELHVVKEVRRDSHGHLLLKLNCLSS